MAYPEFMTVCDTAQVTIPATNMSGERTLYTTNYLLSNWRVIGYRNTEAHGIKTGLHRRGGLLPGLLRPAGQSFLYQRHSGG